MRTAGRTICPKCLKPELTCYCSDLRVFSSRLEIVILQHPREYRKSIGTGRMAHLCISNSRLIQGTDFDSHPEVLALTSDPQRHCVVLYPGRSSIDIGNADVTIEKLAPAHKRIVVFVIDGTWSCADKMIRQSRLLLSLPQIRFTPEQESEYRIRRQPDPICLSTIEAIHRILELLDPVASRDNLLVMFRKMVSYQERCHEERLAALT